MANPFVTSKLLFAGSAIALTFYGVYFTLSVICIRYLLLQRGRNLVVLIYTIVSVLASTIFVASSAKFVEVLLIESAVNPIGTAILVPRLDLLQQVVYSVKIWLADSLLIYRLWIVWSGINAIIILPSTLFIGTLASGIAGVAMFWQTTKKNQVVDLGIAFHSCSVAMNIIATALIAGKLLYQRKLIKELGGEHSMEYLSASAIFAESGALYSITGIIYIPLYATNSPLIYVFAPLLEAASGIAPTLIVLRIALGVAVSRRTNSEITALQAKSRKNRRSTELSAIAFASEDEDKKAISLQNTTYVGRESMVESIHSRHHDGQDSGDV
ncbi:hypothetical protein BDN70DRAFT_881503 [Pholiota conissans]|uniref:Uncharacterized protein n=1 Tax=Pholiota conissans TaxID=109636 RepID=A0A9P5Z0C7_9AGAR|nr:hypothetical protein BDN70DRAFT_881503 [Pholiota conissans]